MELHSGIFGSSYNLYIISPSHNFRIKTKDKDVKTRDKIPVPYGHWESVISAMMLGDRKPVYDIQWTQDGNKLVWLEMRSNKGVLVCCRNNKTTFDLTKEQSVKGGVGYGGGDFTVASNFVIFVEKDGRLFHKSLSGGLAKPLLPKSGFAASPTVSKNEQWILYVYTFKLIDTIALVDSNGVLPPVRLIHGSDFYMQPVWHPDNEQVAWIEWDQPQMPWDGTRLKMARINNWANPTISEEQLIAGDTNIPVFQPLFSPNGKWLSYIITDKEWDKLVILNLRTNERQVLVEDTTLTEPAWVQGIRVYGWGSDSDTLYYRKHEEGFASLWKFSIKTGQNIKIKTDQYTWLSQISVSPVKNALACIASSSTVSDQVVTIGDDVCNIHYRSQSLVIPASDLSSPKPISWRTLSDEKIYGLYYPPVSGNFSGTGKPPAIINIHSGPTGQHKTDFSPEIPFFTSRGYACLFINYRGSTGYGRSYMTALRGHWGEYDVQDAISGAETLINKGLVDPDRIVIKGSSAGGYTVLNALIHRPGFFKAGLCLYGVTNLFDLATDTHKFEEKYLDLMVGELPKHHNRYRAWSPIFHAEKINDPIAIFQGSEDKVVPKDQAESIVKILEHNHIPHIYRLYEGEGHGWRKMETIIEFYEDVEKFLSDYVL